MTENAPIRVVFVCMGNICRSPAAEGILKHIIKDHPELNMEVISCGIGDWHLGQSPDYRMQQASKGRGIVLTSKAQQFKQAFLDYYDYILAADKEVLKYLYHFAKLPEQKKKIMLITEYSPTYQGEEVPDPYYQPEGAFDLVLDILEDACQGLVENIKSKKQN